MFWSKFAHVTGEFCWDITSFNYKSSFHAEIVFKGFETVEVSLVNSS